VYTEDLLRLDLASPRRGFCRVEFAEVVTPLRLNVWASMLASHEDRRFVDYVLRGIEYGFRIGFDKSVTPGSARKNMQSARDHPEVVSEYLHKELERGVLLGPFSPEVVPEVIVSKFGVIPKSGQPGKWRLIVDLSHPEAASVNSGISPELCSLNYVKVDDVAKRLINMGRGALMAKIDIKSAYRMVPVHPEDRYLLAMKWQDKVFVEAALPFGLHSAPKIFNALADAVEWILRDHGFNDVWHYLDDYILCGPPDSEVCGEALAWLIGLCGHLGIPLAQEKIEGPSSCLVFLGSGD